MTGLLCPVCEGPNHAVEKTDVLGEFVRRQRRCHDCKKAFTTYEGRAGADHRFLRTMHLHRTLQSMTARRRKIVENMIDEFAPAIGARINTGGDE